MFDHFPSWLRQHLAALRALVVFTVLLGIGYPLLLTAIAQLPGLHHHADGSLVRADGRIVGSALIGQSFTDAKGDPISKYFQSRPSAAGDGYDPTSTSASNLGPEDVIDGESTSLLTTVCARSEAVGKLEGVDGQRPYCTAAGVGAVLSIVRTHGLTGSITSIVSVNEPCPATPFVATYDGQPVTCAKAGVDYRIGKLVVVHGPGTTTAVPADAITASGSGLDPDISVAYARLQTPRIARVRGLPIAEVSKLVTTYTTGRALGFIGEPAVNVLELNLALNRLSGQ